MQRRTMEQNDQQAVSTPRRILVVGSVPLSAPWNGADKNLARLLVQADPRNRFLVQTDLEETWPAPPKVEAIRERRTSAMPTRIQKLRALRYLLRWSGHADLVHVVASIREPSQLGMALMQLWRRMYAGPVIQTVPSIGDRPMRRTDYFGDVTVVVSRYTQRLLTDAGIANVVCIHPPVDERNLRTRTNPEEIVKAHNLGPRAVLYPAHYGPFSGIEEIIHAFAQLPPALDDSVLVLACRAHPSQDAAREASSVWELARRAGLQHRVRVISEVADMPALIQACAITALVPGRMASKMDLPLVILESLLLERPVIISDLQPMREALLGQGGFAVRYGDPSALSGALAELLARDTLRTRLGRQGQDAVRKDCAPLEIVRRYQETYQMALDQAPRKGRGTQGMRVQARRDA